jgi:hypothetical protein
LLRKELNDTCWSNEGELEMGTKAEAGLKSKILEDGGCGEEAGG